MKKIIICSLFLAVFVTQFAAPAEADVIMPDTHAVNTCAKVVNLNDFPDIVVIGYINAITGGGNTAYQVEDNNCLSKGYKFNSLDIYWNTKDKGLLIDSDKLLLRGAYVYGGFVEDNNPLVKENIEYSLSKSSAGELILYKSKQTSEYNNGAPKKIETFKNPQQGTITPTPDPTPAPTPEPVKKGFWQTITCFFAKLFGMGCK